MSSTNITTNNINPKSCTYGCGLQIYWNTSTNEYWKICTKKKHICPNKTINILITPSSTTTTLTRPNRMGRTIPSFRIAAV